MIPTSRTRHRPRRPVGPEAGLAFALAVSQSDELESATASRARRRCTSAISARTRSCRITFRAASPSAEDSSERQSSGRPAAMPRAPARSARSLSSGASTLVHFDGKTHERAFDGHSCGVGGWLGQRVRNFVVGASHLDAVQSPLRGPTVSTARVRSRIVPASGDRLLLRAGMLIAVSRSAGSSSEGGRRPVRRSSSRIRFMMPCRKYACSAPSPRSSKLSSLPSVRSNVSCTMSWVSVASRAQRGSLPVAQRCRRGR